LYHKRQSTTRNAMSVGACTWLTGVLVRSL